MSFEKSVGRMGRFGVLSIFVLALMVSLTAFSDPTLTTQAEYTVEDPPDTYQELEQNQYSGFWGPWGGNYSWSSVYYNQGGQALASSGGPFPSDSIGDSWSSGDAFGYVDEAGNILARSRYWADGPEESFFFEGQAIWDGNFTNESGFAQVFDFSFLVDRGSVGLEQEGHFYASDSISPGDAISSWADLLLGIYVNDNLAWFSHTSLSGNSSAYDFTSTGTALPIAGVFGGVGFDSIGYDFNPLTDSISLGVLNPNETVNIRYELFASIYGETGGRDYYGAWARVGDPFGFGGSEFGGFSGTFSPSGQTVVPEPATLLIFGLGLGAVAVRRFL